MVPILKTRIQLPKFQVSSQIPHVYVIVRPHYDPQINKRSNDSTPNIVELCWLQSGPHAPVN